MSEIAPVAEAQITLSENTGQEMLVEEIRKGEDRQVWIASWKRPATASLASAAVTLEKKLLWEAGDPILDVLITPETLVAITTTHVTWLTGHAGQWTPSGAADLPVGSWPRDPRGRIRPSGDGFVASLPGMQCKGPLTPAPAVDCKAGDESWVLESGSRSMLLAALAPNRNYFDGRVVNQTGTRKAVAPFYSAASVEQDGAAVWLLAGVDGRTAITDASLEPAAFIGTWGSDVAGVAARCAGGSQVLATRPGDAGDSDAVQAFGISGRSASPLSPPLDFPGPIRAFWPASDNAAVAVIQDAATGRYAAYLVTVACGA